MKVKEIKVILDAKLWAGESFMEREVEAACGADLMSDVLAFAKEKVMLLTGLINPQVIRTAEMLDIKTIVFVRGKVPSEEMIEMAEEKRMVLLSTLNPLYVACGKLYRAGLSEEEQQ